MNNKSKWVGYSSDICVSFNIENWLTAECKNINKYLFILENEGDKAGYLLSLLEYIKAEANFDYRVEYDCLISILTEDNINDFLVSKTNNREFSDDMLELYGTLSFDKQSTILESFSQLDYVTLDDIVDFVTSNKVLAFYKD